jgi:uncharacterized membrane protein YcaP (DUF421 family)
MDVVLRAFVAFCFLVLLFRVIGRRELSSLEPFDLILIVVIGDLVQQGVTQSDLSVTGIVLSVGTFALLAVGLSFLTSRVRWIRPVVEAAPIVVVQDGNVIEENLRRERMTAEEVAVEARQQQIASLEDVAWGVLEGNGKLSFITKG